MKRTTSGGKRELSLRVITKPCIMNSGNGVGITKERRRVKGNGVVTGMAVSTRKRNGVNIQVDEIVEIVIFIQRGGHLFFFKVSCSTNNSLFKPLPLCKSALPNNTLLQGGEVPSFSLLSLLTNNTIRFYWKGDFFFSGFIKPRRNSRINKIG